MMEGQAILTSCPQPSTSVYAHKINNIKVLTDVLSYSCLPCSDNIKDSSLSANADGSFKYLYCVFRWYVDNRNNQLR